MRKLSLLVLFSMALLHASSQPGILDSSFGNNGIQTTAFSGHTSFSSTALQGNKVVTAGSVYDPVANSSDFALARYTSNGSLDPSFGMNGLVAGPEGSANAIVLQGDKIVVTGTSQNYDSGTYGDFALARFTADGIPDSSFGNNGRVITDINGDNGVVGGIVLQGDKIIVAGSAVHSDRFGEYSYLVLVRYTADGSVDPTFGVNGRVTTNFGSLYDQVNAVTLQGNKIIVAGFIDYTNFSLVRYTADGTLDSSFGVNGKVITDFNNNGGGANAIVLQGDKIIAGGYAYNSFPASNPSFALARYLANGSLDPSFGNNGIVTTRLDSSSSINALAVHENRLYAVGSLTTFTGDSDGVVAAYQLETAGPSISVSDVTVCESQKQAVVTIKLSAPSTQVVKVTYKSNPKTAHSVQDYWSVKWTLQFAPGCTSLKVKIPIVDDSICEPTEQFELHLSNPQNATIKDSIAVITIKDDDCSMIAAQTSSSSQQAAQLSTSLNITAGPNPSADAFTILLHGGDQIQPVSIRVYDVSGRLLEQREHLSIGQSLRLGDQYKSGTYIIEAVQGSQRVQAKVIKTGK